MPDDAVHLEPSPTGGRSGWTALLAVLVPLGCLVCLAGCLVIEGGAFGPVADSRVTTDPGTYTALTGVVLGLCGAVVLSRDFRQGLGWTLAWFGLFWAVDGTLESYMRLGLGTQDELPGMTFASWFVLRFTAILPATIGLLLAVFPDGRIVRGRWGVATTIGLVVLALSCPLFVVLPSGEMFAPGNLPPGTDPDPTTITALEPIADVLRTVTLSVTVPAIFVLLAAVVVRYRRATGLDRDRMRWLAWAVTAMALLMTAELLLQVEQYEWLVFFVTVNVAPVAMAIAVVDPHLVDIDDLLARTLTYGGLAAVIVGVDFAVLAGLTAVLDERLDQRQVLVTVLLLTTILYGPLRQRIWTVVRRLMLGDRGTPYDVVAGLASKLERADRGGEQLGAVADAVAGAFGLGFVRLEVDSPGGERVAATHGSAPADVRTLPITYRDEEVGRVVLPVRGLRSRLSRRDEDLLGDLVRQAITAVRTSQLADELQESRERLVVAREEERRRIRRDLHDGLGPALSGVVFQLESARLLVAKDPAQAQATIAATSTHVQDVVADVRRLVHDLRPPALDDLGLVGALRQQAELISRGGPDVVVEAGDLGRLPAAAEVAAFRIASESLANVVRHASASRATVSLGVDDGRLLIGVTDDGVGIPAEAQAGVGLLSLRERASELGGRADVTCPPDGGTVVRAWLPLSTIAQTIPGDTRTAVEVQ